MFLSYVGGEKGRGVSVRLLSSPCFSDGALQIAGRGNTFSVECGMEWTGRTHGMSRS